MPEKYRKVFACGDVIVPYRLRTDDVYEARLRRKDIHIEVSAKNFDQLKKKFLFAMNKSAQPEEIHEEAQNFRPAGGVLFKDYVKEWLSVKEKTVKPSTFKEYVRLCEHDLVPAFGEKKLAELNRATLQISSIPIWTRGRSARQINSRFCSNVFSTSRRTTSGSHPR